jgi:hypothetical protein
MKTFKQFLVEGGAATASSHTERANKSDIEAALKMVSKTTGIAIETLKQNLLGSTSHTLSGKKQDSGDIDIALEEGKYDRDVIIKKMSDAAEGVYNAGTKVGSYAVPVNGKKVQVDLMFVKSEEWARFGFHASPDSKHKGVVRNFLLINLMKQLYEPGKDFVLADNGQEIIRVRRGFKMDAGLERLFRVAPFKKDGKRGPLKAATPQEVEAELKRLGKTQKFSSESDTILEPDRAAAFMFGKGVKASDLLSAEQVIAQIFKRKDHAKIFKDTIKDIKAAKQPVPSEIAQFE